MDDDEIIELVRQVLEDDDGAVPDGLQPPPSFWARVAAEQRLQLVSESDAVTSEARNLRPLTWVLLVVAAACLVAIIGGVVVVSSTHTPSVTAASATPTPSGTPQPSQPGQYAIYVPVAYRSKTVCLPGPTVHPTRSPDPGAGSLHGPLDPSALPSGDGHVVGGPLPLFTDSFKAITEVGGCVQAWILPRGSVVPSDANHFSLESTDFAKTDSSGISTVYYLHDGVIYVTSSGNVAPDDLALAIRAALTRPN